MITTFILVSLGVLALLLITYAARGHASALKDMSELPDRMQPVDIPAFLNLISREEEQYLRSRLSSRQFRQIQRRRLWAATEYVARIANNAAIVLRLASLLRSSSDAELVRSAEELTGSALRLRITALLALAKLWACMIYPDLRIDLRPLLSRYEALTFRTTSVARLSPVGSPSGAL